MTSRWGSSRPGWAWPASLAGARWPASGRGLPAFAEALDGLRLGRERLVQVVEPEDLEDVVHGLVEGGHAQVSPAGADLLDGAHHGAKTRARDVGEALAVDDDAEPPAGDRLLDRGVEPAHGVG